MARYIGDYEVMRELGAGHFGAVYQAMGETPARGRMPAKRRLVAVKKLKDSADPRSVDLLLQEFALLDQVKHRGIVRVFEYLEDEHAVVMEHIHGVSLRQVLENLARAREQVFTEAAIEIGCELADALYQAYTTPGDNGEPLQLVHRDLKPANVMLTPQGEVKILDFGLARVDNADFAKDDKSRVKGTPIYMAPEQARGHEVDHRTDLFALGLILYELLTGEAAYRVPKNSRDPIAEVYAAIENGDLGQQCAELEARLPALGPIVTRLLQRRPEDRYQTGHDVLVDLRRQLYRDRGSYLQEFCEFFFGSICDVGEAPTLDESRAARASTRNKRMSIEERLRQSMAREQKASAASEPPTGPRRAPAAQRPSGPPPTPGPAAAPPPPPPSPGAPMSSPNDDGGSGRRPVRPPVGGTASRAQPFQPAGSSPGRGGGPKLQAVGQRSPDETGMLEMVPLSANQDEADVGGDPSATAFFAIPAPKADRSRPGGAGASPPPMGGPSPMMGGGPGALPPAPIVTPGMGGPPPPPGMGGGFGAPPPPPGGMPPMGGPPPMGGMPPMAGGPMVQGPVATGFSGPVAPQMGMGATPFQVQGPTPTAPPGAEAEQRVQSTRLYAILFALFVLIGVAVVVAVWLRPGSGDGSGDEAVAAAPTTPAVVETVAKKKSEDTGIVEAAPPPPTTTKKKSSGTTSTKPAAAPAAAPAAPAAAPGTLTVKLADPSGFTSVVLMCPDGALVKGTFAGGSTTLSGVPAGQACTLSFKGGISPYRFNGAKAGQSLNCAVSGTAMVCQ